jgi:hypothetical protein
MVTAPSQSALFASGCPWPRQIDCESAGTAPPSFLHLCNVQRKNARKTANILMQFSPAKSNTACEPSFGCLLEIFALITLLLALG